MTPGSRSLLEPDALLGSWRLSRVIDDRLSGARSRIDGHLSLDLVSPGRIRWTELGRWRQPGWDIAVHRGLWLVQEPEPGSWEMRFEDGRRFHPWTPGEPVVHPCGPDTYRGVVRGTPQRWSVEWEVCGPSKDYRMVTELDAELSAGAC